jgi:hypothetical protein
MYDRIEAELRGVQQALYSSRTVSTAPPPSEEPELGDEPAQLCRLADVTEAHLHRAQAEKYQATVALKQAQEEVIEKSVGFRNRRRMPLKRSSKKRECRSNRRKKICSWSRSE